MTVRIVSRLVLLLVALAAATVLMVGGLSRLASAAPADAVSLTQRDQAVAVERAIETPAEGADNSPTPAIALLFAGIVLAATLTPVTRIYVHHHGPYYRSHDYRPDWF
jgi:hypothetical protein